MARSYRRKFAVAAASLAAAGAMVAGLQSSASAAPVQDAAAAAPAHAKSVTGTWFGGVKYLAPGKFTVSEGRGKAQEFLTAEDTVIKGYGRICGNSSGKTCSEKQLEHAAKKGFDATVKLKNGIATSIVENH
jgi:hypothetical protein